MAERFIDGERVTLRHGWGGNKKLRGIAIRRDIHAAREMKHHPEPGKFDMTGTSTISPHDHSLFPIQD